MSENISLIVNEDNDKDKEKNKNNPLETNMNANARDISKESVIKNISTVLDSEATVEKDTNVAQGPGEEEEKKEKEKEISLTLKLGDIIEITAPNNEILNNKVFIIEYINPNKIKLVNADTFQKNQLIIDSEGHITEKSISKITLLSRNENEGYARQNDLLTGTWINIYFGGDIPTIITGLITNLEDDMIEVKTIDNETIYIDFGYQGIPEDIPIETFEIRPPPESVKERKGEEDEKETETIEGEEPIDISPLAIDYSLEEDKQREKEEQETIFVPATQIKEKINRLIIDADQIEFGDFVNVKETVIIDREKYRYDIENQKNDLLEEMLSDIPNTRRTDSVLNNLHIMITRFIQLRDLSSKFDANHNITGVIKKTANDKPLAEYLSSFKNNLYWVMMVTKNVKKGYTEEINPMRLNDIEYMDENANLLEMSTLFKNYKSNEGSEGQNKYTELYNSLNKYMTPFMTQNPDLVDNVFNSSNGIIVEANVNSDINAIIDNLGELYSTVVSRGSATARKFVIQRYNLGLDKLQSNNLKGKREAFHRVKLTRNDEIAISSIVTLPEPTVRFSQINLPGSNLLVKANLNIHFLNYWQLLKQKTLCSPVEINGLDNEIEYTDTNFVDNIKNYMLDLSDYDMPEKLTNAEIYDKFLKIIIPKIIVLFNLVKKYIKGKLSMVDLITYIEPFLIYPNDLTYVNYKEINSFIKEKIKEYNIKYVEYSRAFAVIKAFKTDVKTINPLLTILDNNYQVKSTVFGAYKLTDTGANANTNANAPLSISEILGKIISTDYGNLFNTSVVFSNLSLMYPTELNPIFDLDKDKLKTRLEQSQEKNKCTTYVIAKKYYSIDKLLADNGRVIYFDRDYDTTNYDIIEEKFKKEKNTLSPDELELYISEEFKKKNKLSDSEAMYMAETLVNRAKKVIDGQYAVVSKQTNESELKEVKYADLEYYIRENDNWVLAEEIDPKWFIQDEDILCNIQTDCLYNITHTDVNDKNKGVKDENKQCESVEVVKNTMIDKALKDIMKQFDNSYNVSKEDLTKKINEHLSYYEDIMVRLQMIQNNAYYKYNDMKYKLGLELVDGTDTPTVVSPYIKLRDLIVGQSDFIKRQKDIVMFADKYCRQGNPSIPNENDGDMENFWWMYCKETNTKLLPTFRFMLAKTFLKNPANYEKTMTTLIKTIGKESANGDAWVDEHSGEVIREIDFDVSEGYKDGFKDVSHAILEEDAVETTLELAKNKKNAKRLSPEGEMISNIVSFMSSTMGIDLDRSRDFIIKVVTELMNDVKVLEKEPAYREREKEVAKRGKKLPEYILVYSSTLLYLSLGTILIAIQTSIPSIKTRKTFPGCVRSFSGFPLEGEGDDSGLNYLACVAYKNKNPVTIPWNILSKTKEDKVAGTIKAFTVKYLLPYSVIDQRIKEKVEYLLVNPDNTDIPNEHNLGRWTTFLPALGRFHIKHLENITDGFKEELEQDIKMGNPKQIEKILVIESKIIKHTMAIQEDIQKIVEQKDLLLKTANNPFMVNACCNENGSADFTSLQYFVNENPNIAVNNKIVKDLSALLKDLKLLTEGAIMNSTENSKRVFSSLSNDFDEETIYRAFIELCKFQSSIPLTEELLAICHDKPDYLLKVDTIEEKIAKLKRNERKYTKESFLRLFQIVSRYNIINISFSYANPSYSETLRRLLLKLDDENDDYIDGALKKNLNKLLDTYDLSIQEDTEDMTKFKNYLAKSNETMRNDILDFIKRKSKIRGTELKNITNFIKGLTTWDFDKNQRNVDIKISDDGMYNYINFYKNYISLLAMVFPEMIINSQLQNFESHDYWGFHPSHKNDLKAKITSLYEPLTKFFGDVSVVNVLKEIQKRCNGIVLLSEATPALTNIKIGDKETHSVFDKRTSTLLYEYYILQIFTDYINVTKNPSMVSKILAKPRSETDVYSSDFLVEQQLRFSESEQLYIEGDVSRLQENISKLIVAYINMMSSSKAIINKSYDKIEDIIFKLKEAEKYTFTDRLKGMTEELRAVDMMKKANKIGVWERGVSKGLKQYDPETYEHDKAVAEKIAEMQANLRQNANVTDMNIDLHMEDALEEMETQAFIDADELDIRNVAENYYDGDPYGDEMDADNMGDYE